MALSTRTQIEQKLKKEKRFDKIIGRQDVTEGLTEAQVNALIAQYLIDNPPTGGSVINSIQRGSASLSNGQGSADVFISAVDIDKSMILVTQAVGGSEDSATVTFFSTNRLRVGRSASGTITVAWQVIEYV